MMALTVVAAPRGAGKSVLVDTWLESATVRSVVVPEIRRGQTESELWHAVSESLRASGIATPEPGPDDDAYAQVNRQLAGAGDGLVLVLANPDRVAAEGLGARLLALLELHHGLHLVLCVRTAALFPPCHGRDIEHQVVTREDLRFTRAETGEWLRRYGIELTVAVVDALHAHLGGIPRLVRALGPVLWRLPGASVAEAIALTDEEVTRMVAEEVFSPLGSDCARAALVACDVLGSASSTHITVMTGAPEPSAELVNLNDVGLVRVSSPRPGDEAAWTMVPALRAAMVTLLTDSPPAWGTAQLGKLGRWFKDRGDYRGALACGLRVDDWDMAWPVLRDHWMDVVTTDADLVRGALIRLPAEISQREPEFDSWRTLYTAMDVGFVAIKADLARLEEGLTEDDGLPKPIAEVVSAGSMRSVILRLAGQFGAASEMATRIATIADGATGPELDQMASFLPFMRVQWAISHQLAGELEASDAQFRRAFSDSRGDRDDFVARNAVGGLALNSVLRGEIARASEYVQMEEGFAEVPGYLGPMIRISGQVARVMVAVHRCELELAQRELKTLGLPSGTDELWAPIVLAHCAVELALGTPEAGLDLLHRAEAARPHLTAEGSLAHRMLMAAASWLYLGSGRGNEALAVLPDEGSNADAGSGVLRACRAQVYLLSGDPAAALAQVQGLAWREGSQPSTAVSSLMIAGAAQGELGRLEEARKTLLRACSLSAATGLTAPLGWLPQTLEQRLLAAGAVPDELRELWVRPGRVRPFPDEVRIVSLTPRELEIMRLLGDGINPGDMAERLFVSVNTVKSQIRSAYRKLDSSSRNEAVEKARELRLI